MARRPKYRFDPAEWMASVRELSAEEAGVYFRLICMMYERESPLSYSHDRLARLCGCSSNRFRAVLDTLLGAQKITQTDAGLWNEAVEVDISKHYEKRDKARTSAERRWAKTRQNQGSDNANALRAHSERNADAGRQGGELAADGEAAKGNKKRKRKADNKPSYTAEFERFWRAYPPRVGGAAKAEAARAFNRLVEQGESAELLIAAAGRFAEEMDQTERTNTSYVPMASTWLNQRRFDDYKDTGADLFGETDTEAQKWRNRIQSYIDIGGWPQHWGQRPEQQGCDAPEAVLIEFGYRQSGEKA